MTNGGGLEREEWKGSKSGNDDMFVGMVVVDVLDISCFVKKSIYNVTTYIFYFHAKIVTNFTSAKPNAV